MASRCGVRLAYSLALLFVAECGIAQKPPQSALPSATQDALHKMSRLAGVIFTGQVVAVRQQNGGNGATGIVEIDFVVDDAVRGVNGSTYALREWAGLWQAGDQPFVVGQRYLMLLHTPSNAGLSSPVGGMDGAIPIRGSVQAQTPASSETTSVRIIAPKSESTGASVPPDFRMVDLRWVATRVVQPLSYTVAPLVNPTAMPVSMVADAMESQPASSSQRTSYATVLAMLRGWEKTDHATH